MYSYPEYLNACQRIAVDLLTRAHESNPKRFPWSPRHMRVTVAADSMTGTASVSWNDSWNHLEVIINMPVKPADYRVTEAEFEHGVAYLLHEVGHPLHTDKKVWDAACATQRQAMLNYTDDVRQEKATIDLGLAVNATKMFGGLIDSLHAKALAGGYEPNDMRSIGWTLSALGRRANGYALDLSDIDAKLDPNGPVAGILQWALPGLQACVTTQDCLDLSDRITAAMRAAAKPKPAPAPEPVQDMPTPDEPEAQDAEEGEEGPEDQPEDENAPEGLPDAENQTEFEGQGVLGEGKKTVSDEGGTAPARRNDLDDVEPAPAPEPVQEPEAPADSLVDAVDMTPNTSEVITSSSRNFDATRKVLRAVRRALQEPMKADPITGRTTPIGHGSNRMTVDVVTGDASKMGRQRSLLAAALKREENDDYEGNLASGRLNRRAIARMLIGSPTVFGRRVSTEGYDTDVQILIDGSSSMQGKSILAAATLGLVVAQAAAQVGVSCNAHVFSTNGLFEITEGRAKPLGKRFAYAFNKVGGTTPLTQNMLKVAFEQKRRASHKRRILFAITDGGCDMGPDALKGAAHYIETVVGTEIANIHIGYMPLGVFRNECAVNENDVTATGLRRLTQTLEKGVRS